MVPLFCFTGHSRVGNKPGIATAPSVLLTRPSGYVIFVLVFNTDCQPVKFHVTILGEVEDVLVAVIHESVTVNRLEVTYCHYTIFFDRDRLYPVDYVLQLKEVPHHGCHFEWSPWITGFPSHIQEERTFIFEHNLCSPRPAPQPHEILVPRLQVVMI